MVNLLNLKKTPPPVIVEKIVVKRRSVLIETLKMFTVIAVSSGIIWAVSNADTLKSVPHVLTKNFSALGIIDTVSSSTLRLIDAKTSSSTSGGSYTFDLAALKKIEDKSYVPLTISDLKSGDKVVVQGVEKDDVITIRRIIFFASSTNATSSPEVIATSTASSTDEVNATSTATSGATSTATSTDSVATSTSSSTPDTSASSTEATSTPEVIATSTASSTDDVTATSTATSTDSVDTSASSTPDQTQATTTPETPVVTDPTPVVDATTTPDPVVPPVDTTTLDSSTTSQ